MYFSDAFQRTDCPFPHFLSFFSPALGLACLLQFEKNSFPSTLNERCPLSFFLDLHQTTQSFDLPIFFDHCSCSDSEKLSHTTVTTIGPSSSPKNYRSFRNKGGSDMTAPPSSLSALLIFCSARSIDPIGDLYHDQASSFSSVRLVSSWMTVISSCSRSNHCFRKKFQLLLAIVHPLCGSM